MDIARVSMNLASQNTMRNFSIYMIRNQIDHMEQVGEEIAKMINSMDVTAPRRSAEGLLDIRV